MSVEIAWKQNILVTEFHLLKSQLVVFGFGSQAFICGFSRQNINRVASFRHLTQDVQHANLRSKAETLPEFLFSSDKENS